MFESVAEAQRIARKRLPKSIYAGLVSGVEQGSTAADNVAAFSELGFVPKVATGLSGPRDQSTTVVGEPISFPVVLSPTGAQGICPEGEVAVARAAAAAGTAVGLSSFASRTVEDVVAANPQTLFQMYWLGSRDRMGALVARAQRAGAKALIVTLDWTFAHRRDWGSPQSPARIVRLDLKTIVAFGPQVAVRPGWLLAYLRNGGIPAFSVPNLAEPGRPAPTFFEAYAEWMKTPPPSWEDIAWLRGLWNGPFIVKGITHPDDARRAMAVGADAVSVSNHGGNNMDGTPASIRLLPTVAEAVGSEIEVYLDGGIRRGSDVVKAVALGARAGLIGRAYLWGLAAGGEAGVASILAILRAGIDETLNGLGHASVHDVVAADVVASRQFSRVPLR